MPGISQWIQKETYKNGAKKQGMFKEHPRNAFNNLVNAID